MFLESGLGSRCFEFPLCHECFRDVSEHIARRQTRGLSSSGLEERTFKSDDSVGPPIRGYSYPACGQPVFFLRGQTSPGRHEAVDLCVVASARRPSQDAPEVQLSELEAQVVADARSATKRQIWVCIKMFL